MHDLFLNIFFGLASLVFAYPAVAPQAPCAWSPYVDVHSSEHLSLPASFDNAQLNRVYELNSVGAVRGVRLDLKPWSQDFKKFAQKLNARVDVLGIVETRILSLPKGQWQPYIDDLMTQYKGLVKTFEIGNEVEIFSSPPMQPEQYARVLRDVYEYVSSKYPQAKIIPAAFNGDISGPDYLQKFVNTDPDLIKKIGVINIHCYRCEETISQYKKIVDKLRRKKGVNVKVWVTETGVQNWSEQIKWVKNIYPKLKRELGAQRIYFYVFARPKDSADSQFALLNWNQQNNTFEAGNLYKSLKNFRTCFVGGRPEVAGE